MLMWPLISDLAWGAWVLIKGAVWMLTPECLCRGVEGDHSWPQATRSPVTLLQGEPPSCCLFTGQRLDPHSSCGASPVGPVRVEGGCLHA